MRTVHLWHSQRFASMEETMEHFRHQYNITTAEQEAIVWDHLGRVLKDSISRVSCYTFFWLFAVWWCPLIRLIFRLEFLGALHNSAFDSEMDQMGIQQNQDRYLFYLDISTKSRRTTHHIGSWDIHHELVIVPDVIEIVSLLSCRRSKSHLGGAQN